MENLPNGNYPLPTPKEGELGLKEGKSNINEPVLVYHAWGYAPYKSIFNNVINDRQNFFFEDRVFRASKGFVVTNGEITPDK